jgi:predicted AlkP superfamily pyrophosphatase or phosphodiesterase
MFGIKKLLCIFLAMFAGVAAAQTNRPPVLMISVDGMRPDYVTGADVHGLKIPILRSMIQTGCYADGVTGVLPTVTHPSHVTLVTGVWPIEHGIYNNTIFSPQGSSANDWYWYEPDIHAETLWHAAQRAGVTTASVWWPVTTNAADIDTLVPGYPARTLEESNLIEALSRPLGYLHEVEKTIGPFHVLQPTGLFDELLTKTSIAILKDKKPGFMTVHFVSLDGIEHGTGPFSAQSNAALEAIDGMIGRLVATERENDPRAIVVVVSDHGFANIHAKVNLLVPFVKAGLITLDDKGAVAAWKATMWNADGSAYILLHDPNDAATKNAVAALLAEMQRDPANGIARVLTHEEIVAGGGDPNAAFMVAWKPGFETGGAMHGDLVQNVSGAGTHGYLPEFAEMRSAFFMTGNGVAKRDLGVIDMRSIAPTVAAKIGTNLPQAKMVSLNCTQ